MNRAQLDAQNDINIMGTGLVTKERHTSQNNAIAEYATNTILVTVTAGTTITDSRMAGRDIGHIDILGIVKNTGFTKVSASALITFTDGTAFLGGEKVTITMI